MTRRVVGAAGLVLAIALNSFGAEAGSADRGATASSYQLGLNTFITYKCQDTSTYLEWATTQIEQYRSLGANSIGLSFPIYTSSLTSNRVFAALDCAGDAYQTPPVTLLGRIVELAQSHGLQVFLRPLLTIPSGSWRGKLAPTNVGSWIASYDAALDPYLVLAQDDHVARFALATELDTISTLTSFQKVVRYAKARYRGKVVITYTWNAANGKRLWNETSAGVDTYPHLLHTSPTETSAQLLAQWDALLKTPGWSIPRIDRETINEIGIMAQDGAYANPLAVTNNSFDQSIQANWFTAACLFMKQHKMQGIYYWGPWMASLEGNLLTSPSPAHPIFFQPAAQAAIKSCFKS